MSHTLTSLQPRLFKSGGLLCALMCLAAAYLSCTAATPKEGDPNMSGTGDHAAVSTDAKELGRFVTLPYEPRSVAWQRRTRGAGGAAPGPTDWSVVCVLELSDADAARLSADAGKGQPDAVKKVRVFEWFPEAVRRRAGEDGLLEGRSLDAGGFYKSPLNNGSLVRVPETDYFILVLYTM